MMDAAPAVVDAEGEVVVDGEDGELDVDGDEGEFVAAGAEPPFAASPREAVGRFANALQTSVAIPSGATGMIGAGFVSTTGLQPGRCCPGFVTSSWKVIGNLHLSAGVDLPLKYEQMPTSSLP